MRHIIYETSGRAAEYYPLGCHLYKGCTHGCTYCYNTTQRRPGTPISTPVKFEMHESNPFYHASAPEHDYLNHLAADADRLAEAGDNRRIMLSFTCDPYQPLDTELQLTRKALLIIKSRHLPVALLTKGGERSLRDFDLLEPTDEYGITLTGGAITASQFEPGSAPPEERIEVLRQAKERWLRTWVSFEPVLYPAETLKFIELVAPFTDIIRVGKLNHIPPPAPVMWGQFCRQAIDLLNKLGATYYIKKDLARHIDRPDGIKGGPGW